MPAAKIYDKDYLQGRIEIVNECWHWTGAIQKNRFPHRAAAWAASVESRKIPQKVAEEVILRYNKGEHKETISIDLKIGRTTVYRIINNPENYL